MLENTAPAAPAATPLPAPTPMAGLAKPVDWLFAFKFNGASFPGCSDGTAPVVGSPGIFGGVGQKYDLSNGEHSQQYVYATSLNPTLVSGEGCIGASLSDPLGATFGQIYNNPGYHYVLWNDQFYGKPIETLGAPAGHSKGMVAWNDDGEGLVLQVSTPSWPASGSFKYPRQGDGNTLGCISDDDIEVSQHFFALKINHDDLKTILTGLINASVVTGTSSPGLFQNGGPADVQELAGKLGPKSNSTSCLVTPLSTGVKFISKPSDVQAPPWQLVSSILTGLPLRVASWWADPEIYSNTDPALVTCWPASLSQYGKTGPVEIATSGTWNGTSFNLKGEEDGNHAKIGISKDPAQPTCIFGDLNQQGSIAGDCGSSQNGRGGTFYVLQNQQLFASLTALLAGGSAPTSKPA